MSPRKKIILGVQLPGANNHTVWTESESGSQIAFSSFKHLARTAERGKFDFFFLAEGLKLREHHGRVHDLDIAGRPDIPTMLTALASVTTHLGLIGTVNATFNEPYELARKIATLDRLSGGRAGWNVVTTSDAPTGENFRRGGYLDHSERYVRAAQFAEAAFALWDSWPADEPVVDTVSGRFVDDPDTGRVAINSSQFSINGRFALPRSPQGRPVIVQAGNSDEGRDVAARLADAIYTPHGTLQAGQEFYADITRRLQRFGRTKAELKILPQATYVLGDTDAEARERHAYIRRQQVSPQTAILLLEQVWNTDLSELDPDGPLPAFDPAPIVGGRSAVSAGRTVNKFDNVARGREWRERAEAEKLSVRELIVEVTTRPSFVGTPQSVADQLDERVQLDAADGFVFAPHLTPGGLDELVDKVVPLLQERGSLREDYTSTTLRGNLGLPDRS